MPAGELAPCLGVIEASWQRIENQTDATANSGEADVIELGDPYWDIDVAVNIRDRAHFDAWDSFLARRRQADLTFTMHRSMRPRPRDRQITSDAGLTLSSFSAAASTITLAGFGAGRQAHPGDMISYRTPGNGYWIGQVMAPATANGSGVITASVWPRPVTPRPSLPELRRFNALGEFRLTERPRLTEGHKNWRVRFRAEQVLR